MAVEALAERLTFMKESLQKSHTVTDGMVAILGSFDQRLSSLEAAMRPTQVRTHSIRKAHENIDKTVKTAEIILTQFEQVRKVEAKILRGPQEDLESYLQAVDQLRGNLRFFTSPKFKTNEGILSSVNGMLSKAILKLEEEFKELLTTYSKPVEPDLLLENLPQRTRPTAGSPGHEGDSSDKNPKQQQQSKYLDNPVCPAALIPARIMPLLHDIADQMVRAGHQQQCFKVYRDIRASILEQTLRKLGVEKLSKDDVQKMQWEMLESKIGSWIEFMWIAVKLLFSAERKMCNQIFDGIDTVRDNCFAEVTSNSLAVLLSFGEATAKSKRSPEKLFVLLDMYEIMRDLQPEIESVFQGRACNEVRETALSLTKRLALTAQETFGDFEEAIEKDATKTTVADGTVHPLTSYVINYVKFLYDYQPILLQLFREFDSGDGSDNHMAALTMRIMQALQTNLEGKSKQYKDPSLTPLFLMNNVHYIVKSVCKSEANEYLGTDWVQRHRRIVQQHANQYKRIAWGKILQCLSVQVASSGGGGIGDSGNSSVISRQMVKDRFKTFNVQFEDLHQKQSQWTVPDSELREYLRLAIAEVLVPAYRSFLKRFGPMIENGKNPQKYIRYKPEDLDHMLGELFEGKAAAELKR